MPDKFRFKKKRRPKSKEEILQIVMPVLAVLVIIGIVLMSRRLALQERTADGEKAAVVSEYSSERQGEETVREEAAFVPEPSAEEPAEESAVSLEAQELPALEVPVEEVPDFSPHAVESTLPSNLIDYTGIEVDGEEVSSYQASEKIDFGAGREYTGVEGVVTFRGNTFRDDPTYGTANLSQNRFENLWIQTTGTLMYGDAYWSGSGWTGQPLLVRWPRSAKAAMNMYDWAREDDNLVEVIYACMDGYVYFLDLETGKPTRENLYLGFTFKGAGALDPRGYPIMYLGAGYDSDEGTARVFIVNLLDCQVMYTFGDYDPFSLRGALSFFDSSAIVDAETDTLIYPGENGILYRMKLNTVYDEAAGTLSINPSPVVKWHYSGVRSDTYSYWLGMEDSIAVYKGYGFIADNGGNLMCIDLNTLELIWVQDILDDSNSTPVLAVEDGHLYLYVSTSFHLGWRSDDTVNVPVWKINAETGEIVWQKDYECYSEEGVSGGVQSTIALGKYSLSDYLYVTVSRTGTMYEGVCACLDRKTGQAVWEHSAYYSWSSPLCVYNPDGSGKVVYCSCGGKMYLLDGKTGEVYDTFDFGETVVEASPAVFKDCLIIGTRDCKIYGFRLK